MSSDLALQLVSVAVMLLSVRLGVAVGMSPPLNSYGLPSFVRMALVLALTVATAGASTPAQAPAGLATDPARLIAAVGTEALIGMMLGLGVHVALAAFAFAGRLLDGRLTDAHLAPHNNKP